MVATNGGDVPDRPPTHRQAGPASYGTTEEPDFAKTVWRSPREVLTVALGVAAGFVGGIRLVAGEETLAARMLGALGVAAAVVLLASYTLRFFPSVLEHPWWWRSRARRASRTVLRSGWWIFIAGVVVVGLAVLVVGG